MAVSAPQAARSSDVVVVPQPHLPHVLSLTELSFGIDLRFGSVVAAGIEEESRYRVCAEHESAGSSDDDENDDLVVHCC